MVTPTFKIGDIVQLKYQFYYGVIVKVSFEYEYGIRCYDYRYKSMEIYKGFVCQKEIELLSDKINFINPEIKNKLIMLSNLIKIQES